MSLGCAPNECGLHRIGRISKTQNLIPIPCGYILTANNRVPRPWITFESRGLSGRNFAYIPVIHRRTQRYIVCRDRISKTQNLIPIPCGYILTANNRVSWPWITFESRGLSGRNFAYIPVVHRRTQRHIVCRDRISKTQNLIPISCGYKISKIWKKFGRFRVNAKKI